MGGVFFFFFRSAGRHNVFGTCGGTRAPVFGTPNRRNSKTKHQIKNNNNNKRNGILPDRFPLPTSSKTKSAGTREKRIQIWFDEKKNKEPFSFFSLIRFPLSFKEDRRLLLIGDWSHGATNQRPGNQLGGSCSKMRHASAPQNQRKTEKKTDKIKKKTNTSCRI